MGMSSRNFTRVCLREPRMNPGQFVDRMRVEAAQQMIDSSAMVLRSRGCLWISDALAMHRTFLRVSALLPANMQAALSGRKARPKRIDEATPDL